MKLFSNCSWIPILEIFSEAITIWGACFIEIDRLIIITRASQIVLKKLRQMANVIAQQNLRIAKYAKKPPIIRHTQAITSILPWICHVKLHAALSSSLTLRLYAYASILCACPLLSPPLRRTRIYNLNLGKYGFGSPYQVLTRYLRCGCSGQSNGRALELVFLSLHNVLT